MTALVVLLGVVVALLVVLVIGLLRSHAEVLRRLHELGAGIDREDPASGAGPRPVPFRVRDGLPAPGGRAGLPAVADLAGRGPADDAVAIRIGGVEHRTLLAFLSSNCLTCQTFWDALGAPELLAELPADLRVVVVTKGPEQESPSRVAELAPDGIDLVMSSEGWADYDVPGSPYFVLVDGAAARVRGEGTGASWPQVRDLLAQATGDAELAAGSGPGGRTAHRATTGGPDNAARVDRELLSAGIAPGDTSLWPGAEVLPDDDRAR